jgi:hypothetical protein
MSPVRFGVGSSVRTFVLFFLSFFPFFFFWEELPFRASGLSRLVCNTVLIMFVLSTWMAQEEEEDGWQ